MENFHCFQSRPSDHQKSSVNQDLAVLKLSSTTIIDEYYKKCAPSFNMTPKIMSVRKIIDQARSLKAKIIPILVKTVARSIKVFRFLTTKKSPEIVKILGDKKTTQGKNSYPKIINVQNKAGDVCGSLQIRKNVSGSYEILFYEFTIKPNGVIFLQGKTAGRNDVTEFLAETITSKSRYDVIKEYELTDKNMTTIFKNITKENNNNVILELKVTFNPDLGHKHEDKEIYGKLSYQFIANRCASKHKNFDDLLKDGKEIEMVFGLLQCAGLEREERQRHTKLIAKSDCSFRMYREVPHDDWLTFIQKVLNFI